ncbi:MULTISPECIES: PDZ domain-containing protein [Pectinatus]|uniref:PDZ domain-containing protein n=1 Tax=Pectinatus TaxID=864 RepID=UPI0018C55A57|nr:MULTISPECIES: PDZ domain-containing protein [Pectinatus]
MKKVLFCFLFMFLICSTAFAMSSIEIEQGSPTEVRDYLVKQLSGKPAFRINNISDALLSFSETREVTGGFMNAQRMTIEETCDFTFTPEGSGTLVTLSDYYEPVAVDGILKSQRVKYNVAGNMETTYLQHLKAQFDGSYRYGFNINTAIYGKNNGLVIISVDKDSPAKLSGLEIGDSIISIDGQIAYMDKKSHLPTVLMDSTKATTSTFLVKKKDGSQITLTMTSAYYSSDGKLFTGLSTVQ